jgi:hypothetical protein
LHSATGLHSTPWTPYGPAGFKRTRKYDDQDSFQVEENLKKKNGIGLTLPG